MILKHSISEKRYICIGKSNENRVLFCYFTIRGIKMRIIGIRIANEKKKHCMKKRIGKIITMSNLSQMRIPLNLWILNL